MHGITLKLGGTLMFATSQNARCALPDVSFARRLQRSFFITSREWCQSSVLRQSATQSWPSPLALGDFRPSHLTLSAAHATSICDKFDVVCPWCEKTVRRGDFPNHGTWCEGSRFVGYVGFAVYRRPPVQGDCSPLV